MLQRSGNQAFCSVLEGAKRLCATKNKQYYFSSQVILLNLVWNLFYIVASLKMKLNLVKEY